MYKIAICDDEAVFRLELIKICNEIMTKLNIEFCISEYSSGDLLFGEFQAGLRFELLLLDICMDDTNGVDTARKIREFDKDASIVFITSSPDFAMEGYDVKALHYLMKPPDAAMLERLIFEDYERKIKNNFLVFKSGSQILRVPINEIICLETVGRRVEITLKNRSVEYPGKLSDLLAGNNQLTRCHKAFAVNIRSISELTRSDAIAFCGKKIPVSRTYIKDVQQALMKQIRDV